MNEELKQIMDIWFPSYSNGMMYMEETNEEWIYYKGIPGLTKEDLDIRLYTEKDFISIYVKSKKNSIFVEDLDFRIVKVIDEVSQDKTPEAKVENGILEIILYKANPIIETEL